MILALLIGSGVICVTLVVAAVLFQLAIGLSHTSAVRRAKRPVLRRSVQGILFAMLWIIAVLTITVWIWAVVLLWLGLFDGMEPALYYALSSFTTVGYGDVILENNWRILGGMCAANGLLIFGLFTAFLLEVLEIGSVRGRD